MHCHFYKAAAAHEDSRGTSGVDGNVYDGETLWRPILDQSLHSFVVVYRPSDGSP